MTFILIFRPKTRIEIDFGQFFEQYFTGKLLKLFLNSTFKEYKVLKNSIY
jgi:hypothetical protein